MRCPCRGALSHPEGLSNSRSCIYKLTDEVTIFGAKLAWSIFIFTLKLFCCCGCCGLLYRKSPAKKLK